MVSSRLKIQYCKVIIATSLVWFLLDVFLLMYFTDCTMNASSCMDGKPKVDGGGNLQTHKPGGILNRLLPRGKNHSKPFHLLYYSVSSSGDGFENAMFSFFIVTMTTIIFQNGSRFF